MSNPVNRDLLVDIAQRLPVSVLSRGFGRVARLRRPRLLVAALKHAFVHTSGIEMSEAAAPVESYESLADLFVRGLRHGARPIDPAPSAVVSPVDATVGACGRVDDGELLQVKGRSYPLARLLDDPGEARRFDGGPYATLYLAPRDYHRVHAPVSGTVSAAKLVPGRLLPVFPEAVGKVAELFARNERIVTYLDSPDAGRLAVVMVGATFVGAMSVTYDSSLRSNDGGSTTPRRERYEPARPLAKGALLGVFELGSTVVLVGEPGRVRFDLTEGAPVRVGRPVGVVVARATRAPRGATQPKPRPRGAQANKPRPAHRPRRRPR